MKFLFLSMDNLEVGDPIGFCFINTIEETSASGIIFKYPFQRFQIRAFIKKPIKRFELVHFDTEHSTDYFDLDSIGGYQQAPTRYDIHSLYPNLTIEEVWLG